MRGDVDFGMEALPETPAMAVLRAIVIGARSAARRLRVCFALAGADSRIRRAVLVLAEIREAVP